MANPRAEELRLLDDDELANQLDEAKKELFNLRFRNVTGQLDNSSALTRARRDVARIMTLQRHREIEAAEQVEQDASGGQEAGDG